VVLRQQVAAAFMERGDSLSSRVARASATSCSERLWWAGARDGRVWMLPRAWLTRRRIAKDREARSATDGSRGKPGRGKSGDGLTRQRKGNLVGVPAVREDGSMTMLD
jgi:hypothetical protein